MSTVPGSGSLEGGGSRLEHRNPIELGRDRFVHELRPAVSFAHRAGEFAMVVGMYRDTLIEVADKKLDNQVVQSAYQLVTMDQLKKNMGESSDQWPELGEEIRLESRKVFNWFAANYGGMTLLLSSYVDKDPQLQEALIEQVGVNLAHWVAVNRSMARGARTGVLDRKHNGVIMNNIGEAQIRLTADFLLNHSRNNHFQELRGKIPDDGLLLTDNLENLAEDARMSVDILRLDDYARNFEIRDWFVATGREARQGRKIYLTPFYRDLIRELHFQTERKNGIGGVILLGDPGTGKTEVLREKNRQQGYETRVINIHHYTSFNELIADRAIQLGLDRGASLAQKLDIVCTNFASTDPQIFKDAFTSMFEQIKSEGKVREDEALGDFLSSFVDSSLQNTALKGEYSEDDWKLFRDSFITRQRARILRTSLADSQQEGVEDIVKGEILLAIEKGERVVLDEVDKAGPGALSGVLSFLAKPPGERFAYGQRDIQIPYWFTADATTNSIQLDSYLTDRFVPRRVDTPPVLDQLMIAGVRVSDTDGNILLSPDEQNQLVWFYSYVVPEVNLLFQDYNKRKAKDEQGLSPLSNRRIQELTGYLVNFGAKRRTNKSFAEAAHEFLLANPLWSNDPELAKQMQELLGKYSGLMSGQPGSLTSPSEPPVFDRAAQRRAAFEKVVNSPLTNAVRVLTHERSDAFKHRLVSLTSDQIGVIENALSKEQARTRGDELDLPIGLELFEERNAVNEAWLGLRYLPEGRSEQIIARSSIKGESKILGASNDGRIVVLSTIADQAEQLLFIPAFRFKDKQEVKSRKMSPNTEVQVDDNVTYIGIKQPNTDTVFIFTAKGLDQPMLTISAAKRFKISNNGRFVLVEYLNGETRVISTQSAHRYTEALPVPVSGGGWGFAGENLIVAKTPDQRISSQAVYLG